MKIKNYLIVFFIVSLTTTTLLPMCVPMHELMLGWSDTARNILIERPIRSFLSLTHRPKPESFNFTSLPQEIKFTIIDSFIRNNNASTLQEAVSIIRSLTTVNKEVEKKINKPLFCVQIIKYLSQKFGYSNQTVAEFLKTKEAKRRLEMQTRLWNGIFGVSYRPSKQTKVPQQELDAFLNRLKQEGADFNFTYTTHIRSRRYHKRDKYRLRIIIEHAWMDYPNDEALLNSITNV